MGCGLANLPVLLVHDWQATVPSDFATDDVFTLQCFNPETRVVSLIYKRVIRDSGKGLVALQSYIDFDEQEPLVLLFSEERYFKWSFLKEAT